MSMYEKKCTMEVTLRKTKCDGCGEDQLSDAEALQCRTYKHLLLKGERREFVSIDIPNPKYVPPKFEPQQCEMGPDGIITADAAVEYDETMHPVSHVRRDYCVGCAQGRFL